MYFTHKLSIPASYDNAFIHIIILKRHRMRSSIRQADWLASI